MSLLFPIVDKESGKFYFSIDENGFHTKNSLIQYQQFIDLYQISFIHEPDRKPSLKPKNNRVCMFCGKSMPEVAFKKVAHILPQLMGNQNLISDEECDTCNGYFSNFEGQLSQFMGALRPLTFLKGQSGIPKVKSPDKNLTIGERLNEKGEKEFFINSIGEDNKHIKVNSANKTFTVNYVKHPYNPIKVFKALLKPSLVFLTEAERNSAKKAFDFLMGEDLDSRLEGFPLLTLYHFVVPGIPFPSPLVIKGKRKPESSALIPEITFIIYFQKFIYQIFLPFNTSDKPIIKAGNEISLPILPPLLHRNWIAEFGLPSFGSSDLSMNQIVRNEEQNISMKFEEAIEHNYKSTNTYTNRIPLKALKKLTTISLVTIGVLGLYKFIKSRLK